MTTADRPHDLTRYKHGPDEYGNPGIPCRCPECRAANSAWQRHQYRMAAYGQWDGWVDAAGTRRRIQALIWNGWSVGLLAARLGSTRQALRTKLHHRERLTAATVRAVRDLYGDLWDQPPPERTRYEKRAATMARNYARQHGFVPPLAWDAIDDPDATPVPGWERGEKREWGTLAAEALDLIGFGLDQGQAAERLGVSRSTLGTTLSRARRVPGEEDGQRGEQDAAA